MADIYKVAVGITLSSNAAGVLGEMASLLRGVDGQVQGLIGRWNTLGESMKSTVKGIAQVSAGLALGDIVGKITEAGSRLVTFQGQLQNLGKSQADIQQDTQAAIATQIAVHGTSASENLKILRELAGVTANSDDARKILPGVMKEAVSLSALFPGRDPAEFVQQMVKTAELRGDGADPSKIVKDANGNFQLYSGAINVERMIEALHQQTATMYAAGGLITPQDMLSNVKQAGPMARLVQDAGDYWRSQMTAIMDMGGLRAGTADTALGRQLLGLKMSKQTQADMAAAGLITADVENDKTGQIVKRIHPVGEDMLEQGNVQGWMEKYMVPAMGKMGATNQAQIMKDLLSLMSTQTGQRLSALYLTSQAQMQKDAALQKAAGGQDLYGTTMNTNLAVNMQGLSAAWQGLLEVLGAPMVRPAIAGITAITNAINSMMGALAAHPDITKNIAPLMGVGALALTGYGTENIARGIFGGGGLTGSAAALNTSAGLLNQAAYALGARGVPGVNGVPGVPGGPQGAKPSLITPLLAWAGVEWASGKMADIMQMLPHKTTTASGKPYDPEAEYNRSFLDRLTGLLPKNQDGSIKWYDSGALHQSVQDMHWNGGHGNVGGGALDLSQAKLPPVQTSVDIKPAPVMLDGRVIGQLIQAAIVKAGSIISGTAGFDGTAQPRPAGQ